MKKRFSQIADLAEPSSIDGMFDKIKPEKLPKSTAAEITERAGGKKAAPVRRRIVVFAAAAVCLAVLFGAVFGSDIFGGGKIKALDLMEGIEPNDHGQIKKVDPASAAKAVDFAVRLFKECYNGKENVLISPLSVLSALAMTQNGAGGETLAQMEQTLGMGKDELNEFFRSYNDAVKNSGKTKFKLANSVWFKTDERFMVNRGFLQTNADYYGADAYEAPFDDTTLSDINNWVSKNTDGMIKNILDRIPNDGDKEAVMYLINALCFDAEWAEKYDKNHIKEARFTSINGTKKDVDMMYSTESVYYDDGKAVGFMKRYEGGRYAFAAFLPNAGVNLSDYVESLDGQTLYETLNSPQYIAVDAAMPSFETEYKIGISDALKNMGAVDAFDEENADFNLIGTWSTGQNMFISRVIHQTYISVTGKGTKAGAASAVEIAVTRGRDAPDPERKRVILNRPFVYMLIDTVTKTPFFIGTVTDVGTN